MPSSRAEKTCFLHLALKTIAEVNTKVLEKYSFLEYLRSKQTRSVFLGMQCLVLVYRI